MRTLFFRLLPSLLFAPLLLGCSDSATGPGTAPNQDELTQFLQDNPDIANELYEETSEDPDEN